MVEVDGMNISVGKSSSSFLYLIHYINTLLHHTEEDTKVVFTM